MEQEHRILIAVASCVFSGWCFDLHWPWTGVAIGVISFCFGIAIMVNSKGWGK